MKVLAVDDALVWRMALQAMVTSLGHECLVAANGREAWQILRAGGIEVLISDRNMPDMDGAQLCSLVRAQASTYVYVILATGLDDPLQVQEGMLAGADDYLVKPAQILASASEPTGDNAYRYGAEEFLVVYTEQSTEGAVSAATRVRAALATRAIVHAGSAAGGLLTVSVGIAEMTTDQADPADAMRQVDAALYHAQSVGRNCIEVADAPVRLLHPVR